MSTIPPWLQRYQDPVYRDNVLTVAANREETRSYARYISRQMVQNPHFSIPPEFADLAYYYSVSVGADPYMIKSRQNRYLEIEPYNRTRVVLNASIGNETGYLNANWVRELAGGKWWIAAQAPLPTTMHTFLSLLRQPIAPSYSSIYSSELQRGNHIPPSPRPSRVRTIVQLTRDIERRVRKADPYFPPERGTFLDIHPPPIAGEASGPPIRVSLADGPWEDVNANCFINKVDVIYPNYERVTFTHFLYTAWPDHGVPEERDQSTLINFLRLVDHETEPDEFVLVHCSAGIGRTGTFITLSSLMRAHGLLKRSYSSSPPLPSSPLEPPIPYEMEDDLIVQEIDSCREQRVGMVQRDDQVDFIYDSFTKVLLGL